MPSLPRTSSHKTPRDLLRDLLRAPDSLMLEIGAGGELLVARIRLWLVLLIVLSALGALFVVTDMRREVLVGTLCALAVGVISTLVLILAHRPGRFPWLSWLTVTTDVTIVTVALSVLLSVSGPQGIHRQVAWMLYLVSIILTALRSDRRLSVYAGLLALAQYVALAAYTMKHYPPEALNNPYNVISWATVEQRVMLLAIFTVITTTIVERMQRLVRLASTDNLTGLPNRTWFNNAIPGQLTRAAQERTPLSVAILDLDHFKAVNDTIGHAAGDLALQHVVATIRARLPHPHWMARLGGEEFVLVFKSPPEQAARQLDHLRAAVADSTFIPAPGQPPYPLTFSAGLASLPRDGTTVSDLLNHADGRLYRAKEQGRNRIVSADEGEPS